MGRCNPNTNKCKRTDWWLGLMGLDFIGSSGQGGEVPEEFGVILEDFFNRLSIGDDYNETGASDFTLDGTDLICTNGALDASARLEWLYGNSFEDYEIEARIQLNTTPSTTTYGLAFGMRDFSNPDGRRDVWGQLYMTTSGTIGGEALIQTHNGTSATLQAQSAGNVVRASGAWYIVRFKRYISGGLNTFECSATKESDGSVTGSAIWTEPLSYPQTHFSTSTGNFCIYNIAASIKVDYLKITVHDRKNIDSLIIGDSITHGAYATDMDGRWATQVGGTRTSYSVSGGSGDVTQRVLDKIQNLIDYNPTRALLMIGGNDILFSVAQATYRANYTSIRNQLVAAGIQVVHLLATPRTTTDITALNTWIQATFTTDTIIDTYTPLKGTGTSLHATYDAGDGTHPNQAGHDLIASTIIAAL